MTTTAVADLKQQLTQLTDGERKEVSAFLLRLGQEGDEWKEDTARRLDEMQAGNQISVKELRERLGHAE